MIEILLCFLPLAMLRVRDGDRLVAAVFCAATLLFVAVNYVLPDWIYYIAAAVTDVVIAAAIFAIMTPQNARIAKLLGLLCIASSGLQFVGFVLDVILGNGQIYNTLAIIYYMIIIAIFVTWNKLDGVLAGHISDSPWIFHRVFLRNKIGN